MLAAIAGASGWTYQAAMEARDDRRYPPPGKLVEIDGHRMHIFCQGRGSPTVIVEQGVGSQSLGWAPINERMSKITTVCAYDRPGMGYSDPIDHATRAAEIASNLHKLLHNAGLTGDLVLVGLSVGGMYAREYYRQFPERVKGMVLVDSSHEQQLIAINLKSHTPRTMVAEGDAMRADLVEGKSPPGLGHLPLIVLSEGKPNIPFMQERLQTWFELQDELTHLSTQGRHVVATQSAHAIHRTEPDLIVDSVEHVVRAVREAR